MVNEIAMELKCIVQIHHMIRIDSNDASFQSGCDFVPVHMYHPGRRSIFFARILNVHNNRVYGMQNFLHYIFVEGTAFTN